MHARHVPETIFFRWAIKELAGRLDCEPTVEAVLAAREKNPPEVFASRVLREANVTAVLVDYGHQTGETWSHAEHARHLPCRVLPVLRLETFAQELILRHDRFETFVDAFVAGVEGARAGGSVALKSIIAYRTGLAVQPTTAADAGAAFGAVREQARRDGRIRLAVKPLNDYLLLRALESAARQSLPVQFHTGFGDPDVDLLGANPLHLRPLLEKDAYRTVAFVLLHASYPYVRDSATWRPFIGTSMPTSVSPTRTWRRRSRPCYASSSVSRRRARCSIRATRPPSRSCSGSRRGGAAGAWASCSTS